MLRRLWRWIKSLFKSKVRTTTIQIDPVKLPKLLGVTPGKRHIWIDHPKYGRIRKQC